MDTVMEKNTEAVFVCVRVCVRRYHLSSGKMQCNFQHLFRLFSSSSSVVSDSIICPTHLFLTESDALLLSAGSTFQSGHRAGMNPPFTPQVSSHRRLSLFPLNSFCYCHHPLSPPPLFPLFFDNILLFLLFILFFPHFISSSPRPLPVFFFSSSSISDYLFSSSSPPHLLFHHIIKCEMCVWSQWSFVDMRRQTKAFADSVESRNLWPQEEYLRAYDGGEERRLWRTLWELICVNLVYRRESHHAFLINQWLYVTKLSFEIIFW